MDSTRDTVLSYTDFLEMTAFGRKAVVEVWMLDLASSRWRDLVQTPS